MRSYGTFQALESIKSVEQILCFCDCGRLRNRYDNRGVERRFIQGHNTKGENENHHFWKDDNVGYYALHSWLRRHLPEPDLCQKCNNNKPYDVANITGIYNRDFSNYQWLCRLCHKRMDFAKTPRGVKHPMYGKHQPLETRKKISDSRKKGLANGSIITWNKVS